MYLSNFLILALAALGGFVSCHPTSTKPLKAFQQFSADLLTVNPHLYRQSSNQNFVQASAITPYGVGHLLAVLNEQSFWRVPSKDSFEISLRLASNQITEAYAQLDKLLQEKDRNTFSFSNIYTPESEVELSAGLTELGTRVTRITEDWETNAPIIANTQIGIESFGNLFGEGELIPFDGAGNDSRAIFVNTLTFSDRWHAGARLHSIGPQPFGRDSARPEFLSHSGLVGVHENERFLSVGIPLKEGNKLFVIVRPKFNINQVTRDDLKHILENSPQGWPSTREMTVELPAFNFSLFGTPMEALKKMDARNIFCNTKPSHENVLQKISQRTFIKVDASEVTVASATGVALSKNPALDYLQYIVVESARVAWDGPARTFKQRFQKTHHSKPESYFTKHTYPKAPSYKEDSSADSALEQPSHLRFDEPFFWYMHDDQAGPLFFGSVLSFERPQDALLPEQISQFESLQSRAHWSCEYAEN